MAQVNAEKSKPNVEQLLSGKIELSIEDVCKRRMAVNFEIPGYKNVGRSSGLPGKLPMGDAV